jgi:hypothetical protein
MAKGLYRMSDGQVLVEYGNRRRVPIPCAVQSKRLQAAVRQTSA